MTYKMAPVLFYHKMWQYYSQKHLDMHTYETTNKYEAEEMAIAQITQFGE